MKLNPLDDRVVVEPLSAEQTTAGGIVLPDSAKEKPQQGLVIAVGKGRLNDEGQRVPLAVQTGDRILFGKFAQEVTLSGEAYLILREEEVLAVLEGGGPTKKAKTAKTKTKTKTKTKAKPTKTKTMKKGKKNTKRK